MSRRGLALLSLVVLGALACSRRERSPAEHGAGVFLRSCAGCHGANGRGIRPPGFSVAPRDLTDPALQDRLTDELLRETVRYGKGQMPPFGRALAEEDVTGVIAYVRTLRRKQ
jgi:mono/diheme cytochrome c family protein